MLRLLVKLPLFYARRINKSSLKASSPPEEEIDRQVKSKTIRSEYKQMRDKFESIDKSEGNEGIDNTNIDLSLDFIKKMLKEEEREEKEEESAKKKITIQDRFRRIGTPQHLITKKEGGVNKEMQLQSNKKKIENAVPPTQNNPLINSILEQSGTSVQDLEKEMNRKIKQAHQDLILSEIMKKSKEKEVKLNINTQPVVEDSKQKEKMLIIRRDKIIEALQQKTDPSQAKFEFTSEDLLNMKYSPEILAKAHQYKNHELGYFKQLINNDQAENNRNSRLNKRHYKDPKDQQRYLEKVEGNKEVPKPVPQNSYKNIKHEQGLKLYEDEQFYKNKAIKQMSQKVTLTKEDLILKQQLQKDLQFGEKVSDIFLDDVVYPLQAKVQRRIAYQDTSFGQQDKKLRQLDKKLKNLGVEFSHEQIKSLSTQLLFQQKHFLEQQQGFQKYLHRKEKKKNMKKELREAHKNVLKDDLDFEKQEEAVLTIKQIREASDPSMLEENYQKLEEYQARKQAVLVNETPQEKQTTIHRKKTFKNMQNFIVLYFGNGLLNHNANQLKEIQILQVIPNASNTVMNIFWNVGKEYLQKKGIVPGMNNYETQFEKAKKHLDERLKKQSGYISGKMTQLLRLRYGPEIRFFFDTKTQKTLDAIEELSKYTKEIAMVQLEEYQKKGLIKTEEESVQYYEKLLNVTKGKLGEFNSRNQLLSKKYQKMSKTQEQVDKQAKMAKEAKQAMGESKTQQRKKKKAKIFDQSADQLQIQQLNTQVKKKKQASDRLWDSIDLL